MTHKMPPGVTPEHQARSSSYVSLDEAPKQKTKQQQNSQKDILSK